MTIKSDDDDVSGVPFTIDELKKIWSHREDPTLEMIFIMCLSGFRISAYENMEVNLEEQYFRGGVKTKNGQERIVPIHSGIYLIVKRRIERDGKLLSVSPSYFRKQMYNSFEKIGVERHTPHDCRDTFATLCDAAKVGKNYLKRLIGHSLAGILQKTSIFIPHWKFFVLKLKK